MDSPDSRSPAGENLMSCLRAVLVVWCLSCLGGTGWSLEVTPANPVPPFSLVRIKLAEGERAWVIGSDLAPVDVEKTAAGLVFTAKPGRYAVLAFTPDSQDQRIVEIAAAGPPTPPPDPVPTDLVNKYGIGLVSWRTAVSLGKPAEARTLSQAYLAASQSLHEHRVTIDGAAASVRAAREKLSPDWTMWEKAVEPLIVKAATEVGMSVEHYRNYLYEAGKSLEIAGRQQVSILKR